MMSKQEFDRGVSEIIHRERLEMGWSQGELGRRAGITQRAISAIESGRNGLTFYSAYGIANALGISITDFYLENHVMSNYRRNRPNV